MTLPCHILSYPLPLTITPSIPHCLTLLPAPSQLPDPYLMIRLKEE